MKQKMDHFGFFSDAGVDANDSQAIVQATLAARTPKDFRGYLRRVFEYEPRTPPRN